jgi:preprotein translocase subunit SecA
MQKLVSEIKTASNLLKEKSIEELELIIQKIKSRSTKEPLENLLVEWFALTQEMSYRTIGLRHFDTQLLAGIILHEGKIVEMKTGEGKTLASTLAVALNALSKKGVHVVTVNDYLAERDQKLMGKIYKGLGLSVGLVKSTSTTFEKQTSYRSDITYLTNSELVFDYLRDSSSYNLNEVVQTPFNFCIIDEIDSILIDEARTPLILSTSKSNNNKNKLYLAKKIASLLNKGSDFEIDEKRREINLTELGYKNIKEKLGKKTLYDTEDPWILEILNALKAQYVFRKNKDYIVLNNKILIVDEFTGRIMEDRRWSMGIHEAMEAKENVEIGGGTKTKTSITYQNFFTLYPKLAGMTGTAKTTEKEFQDIYNLEVVVLPTANPLIRKDMSDLVYQTELAKWKAVLNISKTCFEKGQPVLIGTATVDKSEFLSDLFKLSKIPHQILNARPENVKRESEIVAQAGEKYAITIATNMAGRGTDIILGGNPIFKVKQKMVELLLEKTKVVSEPSILNHLEQVENEYTNKLELLEKHILNLPYSLEESLLSLQNFYEYLYTDYSIRWKTENKEVKDLGGLFVLGTERHETRRIDNQLRGRSGRQGDPGASQFIISLEDELIKIFGGDNIKRWVEYLIQDKDVPLESNILTNSLEEAQKKVEVYNYDLRKNVFQYDDILNTQRKQLFSARKDILCKNISHELFLRYTETTVDELSLEGKNNLELIEKQLDSYGSYKSCLIKKDLYCEAWIWNDLQFAIGNSYQRGFLKNTRLTNILSILDFYWTEHIERMNYIKETISWRSYGQQNPLLEYNNEAFRSFNIMFNQIRSSMLYYFLNKKINI